MIQQPIEIRVKHSLQRLGYDNMQVIDLGDGHVKIRGTDISADDRVMVIAAARTVAGVKAVTNEFT